MRLLHGSALAFALAAAAGLAACQGCRTQPPTSAAIDAAAAPSSPTVRLYVMSTVAGALEPCGCTKDQLGGLQHLAAYIASQAASAPHALVVGAGPLLFDAPGLDRDKAAQQTWKAEAIALGAADLGLAAWAPGANDWASGSEVLGRLAEQSGATLLAANVEGAPRAARSLVRQVGGLAVGLVGVAEPRDRAGALPEGLSSGRPLDAMRAGIDEAKAKGARILVGLAALPRGEALRLAEAVPELSVLVLGKPSEMGEANDAPKPPTLVGKTLVVESSNHLQTVSVVDLFVRGGDNVPVVFSDTGGVAKAEEIQSLAGRIRELEVRIGEWERARIAAADLAARKADLERLRADKARLEAASAPADGSFFRVASVEVKKALGVDARVAERMAGYYRRVNEHNKKAFAARLPAPAAEGEASYLGVEACSGCHEEEVAVWKQTRHAKAYATLEKDFKEFNLDCASCHVTGYGRPGGSTVTHVEKLRDVQCEECHGPGSLHAKSPRKVHLGTIGPETCVSRCHHSPHVESFDAEAKRTLVLGPGHGG